MNVRPLNNRAIRRSRRAVTFTVASRRAVQLYHTLAHQAQVKQRNPVGCCRDLSFIQKLLLDTFRITNGIHLLCRHCHRLSCRPFRGHRRERSGRHGHIAWHRCPGTWSCKRVWNQRILLQAQSNANPVQQHIQFSKGTGLKVSAVDHLRTFQCSCMVSQHCSHFFVQASLC